MDIVKSCCQDGDAEALNMYLRVYQKFDVNKTNKYQTRDDKWLETSYLIIAAKKGFLKVVEVLLDHGAKPNIVCDGVTALSMAVKYGHLHVVSKLLTSGSTVNEQCLKFAVGNSDVQIELLLTSVLSTPNQPSVQPMLESVLMEVCRSKRYVDDSVVEILARHCVDLKHLGAVFNEGVKMFRFHICNILVAVTTTTDESEYCPADSDGLDDQGKSTYHPTTSLNVNSALIWSVKSGSDKQVSYCVNKGASWSVVDPDTGKTALDLASGRSDLKKFISPSSSSPSSSSFGQNKTDSQPSTFGQGQSSTFGQGQSSTFGQGQSSTFGQAGQSSTFGQAGQGWNSIEKRQPKLMVKPIGSR